MNSMNYKSNSASVKTGQENDKMFNVFGCYFILLHASNVSVSLPLLVPSKRYRFTHVVLKSDEALFKYPYRKEKSSV